MKFEDLLLLATRMFKARTLRTFLTILGMSIGIGAIVFLVSLGYGLQKTILDRITTSDSLLTLDVAENKSSEMKLSPENVDKMKSIAGVAEISPSIDMQAQIKFNDLITDVNAAVVNPSFMRLGGIKITSGHALDNGDDTGVVIATSIAQIFGKTPEEILGSEISLTLYTSEEQSSADGGSPGTNDSALGKYEPDKKFKIVGFVDSEDSAVYINSQALGNLNADSFSRLKVKCQDQKSMAGVRDSISGMGLLVSSISEIVDETNKVFNVVTIVLMLFGVIALVVSAIGMFNTMTISLLERTEEVGIMKSIGASDSVILLIFVMESTIMGFSGGLLGVIIGWLEGRGFNGIINMIATHFGGEKIDIFYSPLWFIMTILIFSAVVGFVTGIVPARRASKIDPLEALRYK